MNIVKNPVQARIIFMYEQDFENFITEFKINNKDYTKTIGKSSAVFVDFYNN